MTTIKHYRFKQIFFKQEELTYAEDGQVKKCIAQLAEITSGNITLLEALGTIYDAGLADELFAVILKVNNATIIHQLWNFIWAKYYGIQLEGGPSVGGKKPVLGFLKNSEIMEVLGDFFVLNTAWMNGLEDLKPASTSGS